MNGLTVREALIRSSSFMSEVPDARFAAELFIRHILGWDRTTYFMRMQESITDEQWERIAKLAQQRATGVPVQYLLGEQEFYGLMLRVNESVLIPRPDTEILVEEVLKRRDNAQPLHVADIGTGSGAITIALAVHTRWQVTTVDIAADSLALARENAERHQVADRISFVLGDLLEPIKDPVDILVSNPPYIPTADVEQLDTQVKDYEPRRALDGGQDGLNFYRRLAAGIPQVVRPGGLIAFEVGAGQAPDVANLLKDSGVIQSIVIVKDLAGIERVVLGERI